MAMIIAPLIRARLPLIVDQLACISTPGESIDCLVTQYGLAVNPRREDLLARFKEVKLPLLTMEELQQKAESFSGKPQPLDLSGRVVGKVRYRDGRIISELHEVKD